MSSPVRNNCDLKSFDELPINPKKKEYGSPDLPLEIFIKIFKNLKVEDHYNISLVSKNWYSHIIALKIENMNSFTYVLQKIGLKHYDYCIGRPIDALGLNPNPKKMEEVLMNGFVNLKINNSKVDLEHPFLNDRFLEISELLFKANVCLGYLLQNPSEIFYQNATLPTTERGAIVGMKKCCTLLLEKGLVDKVFTIIKKIPEKIPVRNGLLLKTVIDFLKREDLSSAIEAQNLINNVHCSYSSYAEFSAFFAHHGNFEDAMIYASLIQAEGTFIHQARKAYDNIFKNADMNTSLKLILEIKNKMLYLERFELILLNQSNTSDADVLVDLIKKYIKKKNQNTFLQNLCKNLVLKNNTELAIAIAESFPKKSKRKDYCNSGISKGLILSNQISESITTAKLIRGKTLRTEILKSNALDYAKENIYNLYNTHQNMFNADFLKDLSTLRNAISSKSEKNAVLEGIIYYYRDCSVNEGGLEQVRNALNPPLE